MHGLFPRNARLHWLFPLGGGQVDWFDEPLRPELQLHRRIPGAPWKLGGRSEVVRTGTPNGAHGKTAAERENL